MTGGPVFGRGNRGEKEDENAEDRACESDPLQGQSASPAEGRDPLGHGGQRGRRWSALRSPVGRIHVNGGFPFVPILVTSCVVLDHTDPRRLSDAPFASRGGTRILGSRDRGREQERDTAAAQPRGSRVLA